MARAAHEVADDLRQTVIGKASNDASDSKATGLLSDSEMFTLWQRLIELYGHTFTSQYGEATQLKRDRDGTEVNRPSPTLNTWRSTLAGITWPEVQAGLRRCADAGEDWPPSAPKFRKRCRPDRPNYARDDLQDCALYQQKRAAKMIGQKPATPETAARHIAQLRGQLGPAGGAA